MQTFALIRSAVVALVATVALAVPVAPVSAQSADTATMSKAEGHLDDFVHYALTANVDLAEANAKWLLENIKSDESLAQLMDSSTVTPKRFARAIRWAQETDGLQEVSGQLLSRIEAGRLALSRDQDRVLESIG